MHGDHGTSGADQMKVRQVAGAKQATVGGPLPGEVGHVVTVSHHSQVFWKVQGRSIMKMN